MSNTKTVMGQASNQYVAPVTDITDVFSTYLTSTTSTEADTYDLNTGIDLETHGGLVWSKTRSRTGEATLNDSERGYNFRLRPNTTAAQNDHSSTEGVQSVTENSMNVRYYWPNEDYVSWTFRKASKFFDVVTYTGDGSGVRTISHSLGSSPGCLILKRTDGSTPYGNWYVQHRSISATNYLLLNSTQAQTGSPDAWNSTYAASDVFTVGPDNNVSGFTYVAYLFAHNDGDGEFGPSGDQDIIKCGSYTGDGTTNGSKLVNIGWEPQWLLIKNTTRSENWLIIDSMRGATFNGTESLFANLSQASSGSGQEIWTMDPQGFRLSKDNSDSNQSGDNYIYIAIRRGPLAPPESATEVFDIAFGDSVWGAGPVGTEHTTSNLTVDFFLGGNFAQTRLLDAAQYLTLSSNSAEQTSASWNLTDGQTGIFYDTSRTDTTRPMRMFKRAPSFCDLVAYTGNQTSGLQINHNLGVVPEMMWVKNRDSAEPWAVYHKDIGNTKSLRLNDTNATATENFWNGTTPTETVFTLGANSEVNFPSGTDYIAYLFASLDGVSKVGSYTGNGTSQTIDCGFTSGARFILVKRTDSTGDWINFSALEGIVAGDDVARYTFNTLSPTGDYVDPASSGFIVNSTLGDSYDINISGASYIFYAIA